MMANQNDTHASVVAEMKRVAAELHLTTTYQLDHLMSDNKKLKEEYNKLEKSNKECDILLKDVESQRDTDHQDLKTL